MKDGSLIMRSETLAWYVVRTAQHKERLVKTQLSMFVDDVYLPLLRTKRPRFGKLTNSTAPLFSCYLFARFNLSAAHYKLMHTAGVNSLVCVGDQPCEVDLSTVQEIKSRERNGLIVLKEQPLQLGQRVDIVGGTFCGIQAVFERYLSNADRVAVMLNSVGAGNLKVILRASAIADADSSRGPVRTSRFGSLRSRKPDLDVSSVLVRGRSVQPDHS
jgi:transcription antitermination factor NusG